MADIKLGHFIDKEYLKNSFRNYDKDFLLKKYYLKSNGEEIENNIKKLAEETNERINKSKFEKYYLEREGDLPNPNEADNGIYIVRDEKSIDETCNCFLYTTIETEDGTKAWKILSAPSYIFETENLDALSAIKKHPEVDLIICSWAPNFGEDDVNILNLYRQLDYQPVLLFIGEKFGATNSTTFWQEAKTTTNKKVNRSFRSFDFINEKVFEIK